jgi:hypothetical protein
MRKLLSILALTLFALSVVAQGQTTDTAITTTRVVGKVTAIDLSAGQMTVRTEAGSVVTVSLNEKTAYQRMPPGETKREKAVKIELADITVGDGVVARGWVTADRKSVPAQEVIVVSQTELAQKQERERAEWRKRGIAGIIESLNPQTKEITVTTRTAEGPQPVIIPVTDKVTLRRYAPDSIRFSEAKKSSFAELKVGDQLRAKGERNADGKSFTAEEIVTGSFRTIGGTITEVNATTGEVKINDIQTKQALTVVIKKDSTLKRVPPEFMQTMAQRGPGGAGGAGAGGPAAAGGTTAQGGGQGSGQSAGGAGGSSSSRPAAGSGQGTGTGGGASGAQQQKATGGPGAGGAAAGQGGPGAGGMDIQRVIENLPPATVADLKPGDMVLISSTAGADPSKVTAITLVSGVEPLFAMLQARQGGPPNRPPNLGTINIGIGQQ